MLDKFLTSHPHYYACTVFNSVLDTDHKTVLLKPNRTKITKQAKFRDCRRHRKEQLRNVLVTVFELVLT